LRPPVFLVAALGVLLASFVCAEARAEEPSPDALARRHHERGTTFYNLGQFEEAIGEYRKGYEQKADPVFLYNIAQSYRQLGSLDKALFFYRRYLSTLPDAPNHRQVEKLVVELDQLVAAENRVRSPAPPQPLSGKTVPAGADFGRGDLSATALPREHGPVWQRWWFWAGLGSVVAAGLVIGLVAASSKNGGATGNDLGTMRFF
jgi:tetratricopeptide (TPR) repeat protein